MMKKVHVRVLISLLLCSVLVTSLLPGMMSAASADGKTITGLGTATIGNPTGNGQWYYVYYGKYNNNPVKYRVLSIKTTDFGGTTMLLDCDSTLFNEPFSRSKSNSWENSSIKTGLNGDFFLTREGVFTPAESNAIAFSTKATKNIDHDGSGMWETSENWGLNYAPLTGQKIFLLDAVEASSETYGYSNRFESDNRKKRGSYTCWWLRSPCSNRDSHDSHVRAGDVEADGELFFNDVMDPSIGVSPALNINLASVIFSSLISGTAGNAGAEYKLTIKDSGISVTNGTVTRNGSTIILSPAVTGTYNQVSVVMTDGSWSNTDGWSVVTAPKYYGQLDNNNSFTLPADYDSSWKTYIIAEDVNAGTATDYAGAPVEITIPPHEHGFSYTVSEAAIIASCTDDCPDGYHSPGFMLTLTGPSDLKYDGNPKTVKIDGDYPETTPEGLAAKPATVTYYNSTGAGSTKTSGSALSGAPTNCGNYVAQMTWGGVTASLPFSITKATQAAPAAPTVEDVTENSVTLKATAGYQYSMDRTTWQDSPVFTGLSQNTEYTFYQRIAGDDNHEPSSASTGTTVTTGSIIYTVTNIQGGEHTVGDGKDMVITVKCNADDANTHNRYSGTTVDGKTVPKNGMSTASGSLVLTLKASWLDTLSVGEHKVTIAFTDGTAEASLKIKAAAPKPKPVPKTGDPADLLLWGGLVILGVMGMAVGMKRFRLGKKK